MKKQLLFLLILLVIKSNNLFSQQYQPFPESTFSWVVETKGPIRPITAAAQYSWIGYENRGDTIIDNITYQKVVKRNNTSYPYTYYDSIEQKYKSIMDFGPSKFSFAYRNDVAKKRVYIYTKINDTWKDTLWYDFNLKVGDTLKPSYSFNNADYPQNERGIVEAIDSLLICAVYYKRFNFMCGDGWKTSLIEGVGFEDDFVQTDFWSCPFEPVYLYSTSASCTKLSIPELTNSVQTIQLFPNPAKDRLSIKETNIQLVAYTIIDCLGRPVFSDTYASGVDIDVSKLTAGIYFIQLTDKNNNLYQGKFIKE